MRKFEPGNRVRIELDATILKQSSKGNSYWYDCLMPDGTIVTVNLARIHLLADEPIVDLEADGSLQIVTTRLSRQGWENLIARLQGLSATLDATACTQDKE